MHISLRLNNSHDVSPRSCCRASMLVVRHCMQRKLVKEINCTIVESKRSSISWSTGSHFPTFYANMLILLSSQCLLDYYILNISIKALWAVASEACLSLFSKVESRNRTQNFFVTIKRISATTSGILFPYLWPSQVLDIWNLNHPGHHYGTLNISLSASGM